MLGMLLSAVLSFWKHKWGPLLAIKSTFKTNSLSVLISKDRTKTIITSPGSLTSNEATMLFIPGHGIIS